MQWKSTESKENRNTMLTPRWTKITVAYQWKNLSGIMLCRMNFQQSQGLIFHWGVGGGNLGKSFSPHFYPLPTLSRHEMQSTMLDFTVGRNKREIFPQSFFLIFFPSLVEVWGKFWFKICSLYLRKRTVHLRSICVSPKNLNSYHTWP